MTRPPTGAIIGVRKAPLKRCANVMELTYGGRRGIVVRRLGLGTRGTAQRSGEAGSSGGARDRSPFDLGEVTLVDSP